MRKRLGVFSRRRPSKFICRLVDSSDRQGVVPFRASGFAVNREWNGSMRSHRFYFQGIASRGAATALAQSQR